MGPKLFKVNSFKEYESNINKHKINNKLQSNYSDKDFTFNKAVNKILKHPEL